MTPEWQNQNLSTDFPFTRVTGAAATLLGTDLFADLSISLPYGAQGAVYLYSLSVSGEDLVLTFTDGEWEESLVFEAPQVGTAEMAKNNGTSALAVFGPRLTTILSQPGTQYPTPSPQVCPRCLKRSVRPFEGFFLDGEEIPVSVLRSGYNIDLSASGRRVVLGVSAGAGEGVAPCGDSRPMPVKTVNGISPDPSGNLTITPIDCLRLSPPAAGGFHDPEHSLQLESDCVPCCDDEGYNRIARAIEAEAEEIKALYEQYSQLSIDLSQKIANLNEISVSRTPPMVISGNVRFFPAHVAITVFNASSVESYGLISLSEFPEGFSLVEGQQAKILDPEIFHTPEFLGLIFEELSLTFEEKALMMGEGAIGGQEFDDPPPWPTFRGDHRQTSVLSPEEVHGFRMDGKTFLKVWSKRGEGRGLAPGESVVVVLRYAPAKQKLIGLNKRVEALSSFERGLIRASYKFSLRSLFGVQDERSDSSNPWSEGGEWDPTESELLQNMVRHVFVDASNVTWSGYSRRAQEMISFVDGWFSGSGHTSDPDMVGLDPAQTQRWLDAKTDLLSALNSIDPEWIDGQAESSGRTSAYDFRPNPIDQEAAKNWREVVNAVAKIERTVGLLLSEDPENDQESLILWSKDRADDAINSLNQMRGGEFGTPPDGIYLASTHPQMTGQGFFVSTAATYGGREAEAEVDPLDPVFGCSSHNQYHRSPSIPSNEDSPPFSGVLSGAADLEGLVEASPEIFAGIPAIPDDE